jgi:DNA topoisomerase-1
VPRTLILVESPNKAKKIQTFLGRDVTVRASVGHICDLPQKGYGVDLKTFEESYEVRNPKVVGELRQLVRSREYDTVLLATDPDREGEAIAWHLARELKLGLAEPRRVEFREVTAAAVKRAIERPRQVSMARVDAQRSRRVLDRVVGFDVSSEICWPAGATSAGRVQTPALHILCEREREILAFKAETYWTLGVTYREGFTAFVPEPLAGPDPGPGPDPLPGARPGSTPDPVDTRPEEGQGEGQGQGGGDAGRLRARRFPSRAEAEAVQAEASRHPHVVRTVDRRRTEKRPDPPYTTSTMQQDASRKLRLSAKQAADLAQALFEAGYITYHRTDSARVSDEAAAMARAHIAEVAPGALPASPPRQRVKAGAQDAHEAIRPTKLDGDTAPPPGTEKLYALIKARFLASQCKPAVFDRTTVWVDSGPVAWFAQGAVLVDPGYLHFWKAYARQEDEELPAVSPGQTLAVEGYGIEEKQTSPPPRYDTGALIRKLEVSGIGRPATFASIVETLLRRNYVQEVTISRGKRVLQPTAFGLQVDGLLTESFPELVSEGYTAAMEAELDRIESGGGETRLGYLRRWYAEFRAAMSAALPRASRYRVAHQLHSRPRPGRGEETRTRCDRCGESNYVKVARKGGKGSFLACPGCNMMRDVRAKTKPAGCPKCGSALIEKRARKGKTKFFGCVRYGAAERPCDYIEGSSGRTAREETDKPCPKCGREKLVVITPSGEGAAPYYACPDRACKFTLTVGARRRAAPCPSCGGVVVERRPRAASGKSSGQGGASFWSCARYPECSYSASMVAGGGERPLRPSGADAGARPR